MQGSYRDDDNSDLVLESPESRGPSTSLTEELEENRTTTRMIGEGEDRLNIDFMPPAGLLYDIKKKLKKENIKRMW